MSLLTRDWACGQPRVALFPLPEGDHLEGELETCQFLPYLVVKLPRDVSPLSLLHLHEPQGEGLHLRVRFPHLFEETGVLGGDAYSAALGSCRKRSDRR